MSNIENVAPSPIDRIMAGLNEMAKISEVDAHIGSLARQLARAEKALTALADYAQGLEAQVAGHARELYSRETERIQHVRRISDLEELVANPTPDADTPNA